MGRKRLMTMLKLQIPAGQAARLPPWGRRSASTA